MRFLDRHGNPRPLREVFAEHGGEVKQRMRAADRARRARLEREFADDIVIVRGTCGGGVSAGDDPVRQAFQPAAKVPLRNPLAW